MLTVEVKWTKSEREQHQLKRMMMKMNVRQIILMVRIFETRLHKQLAKNINLDDVKKSFLSMQKIH